MTDDDIFAAALEHSPDERPRFIAKACANDPSQLARVLDLLAAHAAATGFLREPAVARDRPALAEQPGDKVGHYKLVQQIGEGGVGVVWLAQQERPLRRLVALKVIKLGMDSEAVVTRFEAERQALALMDHPNIAKVFDAGVTATGRPFFVMELVRGIPITRYGDEHQLTTRQRLALFVGVCEAVHHAHQKGIIHRDLKPSNILVTETGGTAVPKVIDFGIAKATQGRLSEATVVTAFEQFIGTPVYMSPEQADLTSLDIDTRSDIYSLGVLLFELLTGRTPFDAKTILESGYRDVSRRIREIDAPPPSRQLATLTDRDRSTVAKSRRTGASQLAVELRGDLDWIVMRCLEKDRNRRYESASGLAADLQRHLRDEPILARPPSTVYLAKKLYRRHRAAILGAGASLALLLGGGVISTWQAVRATRAEHEQSRLRAVESELLSRTAEREQAARRRAYAADMNLAGQALANDNLGLARKLLERQRPASDEADLRGWEWRYLWQQARSEAVGVLTRKAHAVSKLAVSPDGNWVAVGGADGSTSMINLRTREEIAVVAESGVTHGVQFSPSGNLLALAFVAGRHPDIRQRIRLWNVASRQAVHEFEGTWPLSFSPDGRTVVSSPSTDMGRLVRWDVATGQRMDELPASVGYFSALSHDLTLLARASPQSALGNVEVVDSTSGHVRWGRNFSEERVTALAFSPDARWLAAAAGNTVPTIQIWDVQSGRAIATLRGHRTYATALVFWPDGKTLASASTDQTVRLWDVESASLKRVLRGHELEVRSLALLDQHTLVSGGKDGSVLLWDASLPAAKRRQRIDGVGTWTFTLKGSDLVTIDAAGVVSVVTGPHYDQRDEILRLHDTDVDFGPGRGLARVLTHTAFAHDAPLLAANTVKGTVRIHNWENGQLQAEFPTGSAAPAILGFRAGGTELIVAESDRQSGELKIQAWDLKTQQLMAAWPSASRHPTRYTLSPDGRWLVLRNPDLTQSLLDLSTGMESALPVPASVTGGPGFSADSRWIAAPSALGWVRLWDLQHSALGGELSGFVLGVHCAVFTRDGRRLLAGSGGPEALTIWDRETLEPLLSLEGEGSIFNTAALSPDGTVVAARNSIGQLQLWHAPTMAEIEVAELRNKTSTLNK